jgi:hypothetical protein
VAISAHVKLSGRNVSAPTVPAEIALFKAEYAIPVTVPTAAKVTDLVEPSPITKLSDISINEYTGIDILKRTVSIFEELVIQKAD